VIQLMPISPQEVAAAAKRRARLYHARRCRRCDCFLAGTSKGAVVIPNPPYPLHVARYCVGDVTVDPAGPE
jgi:hypothetical protein